MFSQLNYILSTRHLDQWLFRTQFDNLHCLYLFCFSAADILQDGILLRAILFLNAVSVRVAANTSRILFCFFLDIRFCKKERMRRLSQSEKERRMSRKIQSSSIRKNSFSKIRSNFLRSERHIFPAKELSRRRKFGTAMYVFSLR